MTFSPMPIPPAACRRVVVARNDLVEVARELCGDLAGPGPDVVGEGVFCGIPRVVVGGVAGVDTGVEVWGVFGTGGEVGGPVSFVVDGDFEEIRCGAAGGVGFGGS